MKKAVFILILTAFSIGGSGFVLDQMLAKQGGIGYISSAFAAMKLRAEKPGMPPELVAIEAAKANKGAMGLMKTLADGAQNGLGAQTAALDKAAASEQAPHQGSDTTTDKEVYIRVSENHDAMLKPQVGDATKLEEVKGASEDLSATRKIAVEKTEDGREVVGVVRDGAVEDLNAVDRINAMNIPEHMRERILANYYATGSLPEIMVKESRKVKVKATGVDNDDPYNPKNF
jgi:hypothetical protein